MDPLTCGVGIITCNGRLYIGEQLDSILSQSRRPDHIVVSDDLSDDGTWEFLQEWKGRCPVRVTLIRNETRLGMTLNFRQAMTTVDADIVFTADQDDVWFPEKISTMMEVFERDSAVILQHSDARLVDAQCADMGMTLFDALPLSSSEQREITSGHAFDLLVRRNVVTGATVAFRRQLLALAGEQPDTWLHDSWLVVTAAALGKIHLIRTPLIKYRQHSANVIGVKRTSLLMKCRRIWWRIAGQEPLQTRLDKVIAIRTSLQDWIKLHPEISTTKVKLAEASLQFALARKSISKNPVTRVMTVIRFISNGYYVKFGFDPWSDIARDLVNR